MNTPRRHGRISPDGRVGLLMLLAALGAATVAQADVYGRIVIKANQQVVEGNIRWKASLQAYTVTKGSISVDISRREVDRVIVAEPPGLRQAIGMVQRGQPGAAIPTLTKITKDYLMLEHDIPAARWLAEAHLKSKDAASAEKVLEPIVDNYGLDAMPADLVNVYLDALTESGKKAKVSILLKDLIRSGSRSAAAVAQVKRGDLLLKEGKYREALRDGYLRTIILFEDHKSVVPEALFKAAECFEKMGQTSRAEKMRNKLIAEYPRDKYTRQLQSGG
jgi:TolA-binding protein